MYGVWLSGPPVALLAAAWWLSSPFMQPRPVSDELERVVGILVPLVAALLSPLVAAIVLLFRQLVSEMRANREMSERLGRVVQANTVSSDANTLASNRLADGVTSNAERISALERNDKRRVLREREA